ncbi:MAG: polyprenyl synthetase family protein [Deltaproteobacteria bacterium]|nr:polyprenyl synthetase family protein [Deltaproteobacteria bacterium]MBW2217902.1 polyprenyl synthetase family protein [Deltaproteobacteria bacterium]
MFDLKSYLFAKQQKINKTLDKILTQESNSKRIVSAMRHSLMASGKRLRPVLCIAAAEAAGGTEENVLYPACALEMIHTYSLIHDDLPAMDNDELRRGLPTCHVAFDEATAILAGDALLTLSFEILASNNKRHFKKEINESKRLDVIKSVAIASGFRGMIAGQMMDIESQGSKLDSNKLEILHFSKTGALIEASVYSGAVLGGGSRTQIEQLKSYGRNIGLAFQVADDILDVEGDPKVMGKAARKDADLDKSTYPSVIGIEKSREFAEKLVNNALKNIDSFGNRSDPLAAIARYIIERDK